VSEQVPSKDQLTAMKALRIALGRVSFLYRHCEEKETNEGLQDLHEWLKAVVEDVLPAQSAPEPRTLLDMIENDRMRRQAAEDACAEFVRMQHDIASLLGVDADTDSISLHDRIYDALSARAAQPPSPDPLAVSHLRGLVYHWNEFGPAMCLEEKMHYAHEWLKRHDESTALTKPAEQS
jgi:hypothetical protein